MHLSDILLGNSSKFSEKYEIDLSKAMEDLTTRFSEGKSYDFLWGKKNIKFKVKVNEGNLRIELYKNQAFTPYFKGKMMDCHGKLKIDGKFLISSTSILLAFLWILIFLFLTVKWTVNPITMKDGQYLPFFLFAGFLILFYHIYRGHIIIKSLKAFIRSLIQK